MNTLTSYKLLLILTFVFFLFLRVIHIFPKLDKKLDHFGQKMDYFALITD